MAADAKNYVIEKRGDEYCLLTHDGTRVLGCHPTEAAAQAQERAINISKSKNHADLHEIRDVQIFRTGTWNGDPYSEDDLDLIVEAANQVGFGIPIKAGHRDNSGEPALGWVENLRRVGGNLYADLTSMPQRVFDAIKDRAYDAVSAEIFWDLERNGTKYPRALKALALLGAEIPAVDLAPLRSVLALNAVMLPPHLQAEVYSTELSLREHAAATPSGRDAHPDEMMSKSPNADGSCPDGYEKGDDGQCHLKGKSMAQKDAIITRTFMAEICPECADAMAAKKITRLRIPRAADGTYNFDVLKSYAGFSQGLCDRWGDSEGFRTRCMDGMASDVEDPGAFCNALKQWCGLSLSNAETTGDVHTTKTEKTMATKTDEKPAETPASAKPDVLVRDGELVITMAQISELRRKAELADRLKPLEDSLAAKHAEYEQLDALRREERIKFRMRDVKLPVFRPYVRALYDIVINAPDAKTYSVGDVKEKTAEDVVQMLVAEMNKQAAHLFATLTVVDIQKLDTDEPEDTQGRIAKRVDEYCKINKLDVKKNYRQALLAVLDADPDLRRAYSQS